MWYHYSISDQLLCIDIVIDILFVTETDYYWLISIDVYWNAIIDTNSMTGIVLASDYYYSLLYSLTIYCVSQYCDQCYYSQYYQWWLYSKVL